MTVLTVAAVAAFINLGRWQWHRAAEARSLDASFVAGGSALVDLQYASMRTLPRYTRVRVRGRYDGAHQFLLDNMSEHEEPGYQVLTPLVLPDGRELLVNRGWVPITDSRRHLPDVSVGTAPVQTVVGRLDNLPVPGIQLGHAAPAPGTTWPKLTSFPTMADLSAALGHPLAPRQLLLDAQQPLGYVRDWQPPGMSPARHLSYAFQWWAFAATALVLYVLLNRQKISS